MDIPPRPVRAEREASIEAKIRNALSSEPDVMLWLNEVGVTETRAGSWVRYGLCKGSADLIGVLAPHGRFLSFEVKRPRDGRLRPEQLAWAKMIVGVGGFAAVVRSPDEALLALRAARAGESVFGPELAGLLSWMSWPSSPVP